MKDTLSHVKDGQAHMVNVSAKDDTLRKAWAIGFIALQNNTLQLIKDDTIKRTCSDNALCRHSGRETMQPTDSFYATTYAYRNRCYIPNGRQRHRSTF